MKFRQPVVVSSTNPFPYKQKNRHPNSDIALEVVNTVFAKIKVKDIPFRNAIKEVNNLDNPERERRHVFQERALLRRRDFRKRMLYPSVKANGIVDPLLLQYLMNVPLELSGLRTVLGNNRLNLLNEYPSLGIEELPCLIINIKGNKTEFDKPPIEGELMDSRDKAMKHYFDPSVYKQGSRQTLKFLFNSDGWLIDVLIKRFRGEY